MKVMIRSGSHTGAVVDMPQTEAEAAIDTGYAIAVNEESPSEPAAEVPESESSEKAEPPPEQGGVSEEP